MEIFGIPESVGDGVELEEKVIDIFKKIDITISKEKIESCHRLYDKKKTIVKFSSRKDCFKVLNNKNKLKDMSFEDLGFPDVTKLYVNDSLCPYYKFIWSKCKELYSQKRLASFFTINGTNKIRIREDSSPISITHLADLTEHFLDFKFIGPGITNKN